MMMFTVTASIFSIILTLTVNTLNLLNMIIAFVDRLYSIIRLLVV